MASPRSQTDLHYRDAAWLRHEYVERRRTMAEIADACGVGSMAIYHWLVRHGIERRRPGPRPALPTGGVDGER